LAGVVGESQIDVPMIAEEIINAMRNQHAIGPTGKVVIICLERST
jgi:hypothetical protein